MSSKIGLVILCLVIAALVLVVSFIQNRQSDPVHQANSSHNAYPSLHEQSVNSDEAFKIVTERMAQEKQSSSRLDLPVAEKIRRMNAVEGAGEDMLKQLQKSHFKERFDNKAYEEEIQRRIAAK